MGGNRWWEHLRVPVCVLLVAIAGVVLWRALIQGKLEFGDVDPASLVVSLAALALTLLAVWRPKLSRENAIDTAAWADQLANEVLVAETRERDRLLGEPGRTIDVKFLLRPAPAHNTYRSPRKGTLADIVNYFEELQPQRLVILGAPGSGKTVMAIELILGLLERRKSGGPVPLRIPAASWDPEDGVQPWLVGYLVQTFRLSEETARALVDAYQIIPVIDGLDEMDSTNHPGYGSRAGQALRALNRYQEGRTKARLVLTCRTDQYKALIAGNVWARDAAHIELREVTRAQSVQFIKAAVGTDQISRWQPVLRALNRRRHPLAKALSTPWRLTLAVNAYQQQSPHTGDYLRDPAALVTGYRSEDQIRSHLLDLFIIDATTAGRNPHDYPPEQVRDWLAVLANYLTINASRPPFANRILSASDIVLHELWPLAGNRPRILITILAATIILISISLFSVIDFHVLSALLFGYFSITLYHTWRRPWHVPGVPHKPLYAPRTAIDRFKIVFRVALSLPLIGVHAFALAILLAGEFADNPGNELMILLTTSVVLTATPQFVNEDLHKLQGTWTSRNPHAPIRNDLRVSITQVITFSLVYGLPFGLTVALERVRGADPVDGLMAGLALALAFGPGLIVSMGSISVQYLMMLIAMRGRIPWRLGRFLHWCSTEAGLMRTAGIAYQFRHRELQDYLAATFETREKDYGFD